MKPERLQEFKHLYKEEFGEELSNQEVLARACAVRELFQAIYRPIPVHKEDVYRRLRQCYKEKEPTDS